MTTLADATQGLRQALTWPPPVPWCRVEEVYEPATKHGETAPTAVETRRTERNAAVIAAYHHHLPTATPLAMAWYRPAAGAPITILSSTTTGTAASPAPLIFPPGTRGRPLDQHQALGPLDRFPYWTPISGSPDAIDPSNTTTQPAPHTPTVSIEDGLLSAWHGPFAWLLLATPVPLPEIRKLAKAAAVAETRAHNHGPTSAQHVLEAEQQRRRHRLYTQGEITGAWRIQLLAAGQDEASSRAIAGLLIAATDLSTHGYGLALNDNIANLSVALNHTPSENDTHASPFIAGSQVLAALARLPDAEIPGVRLISRPTFDVTPEQSPTIDGGHGFELGQVLDRDGNPAGALVVTRDTLNRHAFVCGATGTGKSQTVKNILEQLTVTPEPVPWLVIEPAKAEYARMAGRLHAHSQVLAIRPGDPEAIPGCLNPLEPEPGFPLQTHIDLIRALFLAAFEAHEPFPQVLSHAMDRAYRELGWDITLGESVHSFTPRYPTLGDLRRIALDVVERIGYSREITDNVRGFIDVRLGSLTLGTPGRFFHDGHPLDLGRLLAHNTVLELEDVGNDQDKAFLIGAVLIRISEYLRRRHQQHPADRLRHVTVVEEAHRLLKRVQSDNPAAHAVELFASLLAEVRAYGEGVIVAEQIPTKVIPDVVKNSALKIMHRLPAEDDRQLVGATMNMTEEQSRHAVTLAPGQAAVFADGMDRPVLAAMPLGIDRESLHGIRRDPEVKGPRSTACPGDCHDSPCSLRQIALGARLADNPKLTLWIELATVAHLTGLPEPRPDSGWLAELQAGHNARTLECAIAHRIHAAVDTRYPGLAAHYLPETLATHLASQARKWLRGESTGCNGTETYWQAGRHRWTDVYRALQQQGDPNRPHPDTEAWRRRGLNLPTAPRTEQLKALLRHPDAWLPPATVIQGRNNPPYYEQAAAQLDNAPDPIDRITRAADYLNLSTGIHNFLYPELASARIGDK